MGSVPKASVLRNVVAEALKCMSSLRVVEVSNAGLDDVFFAAICEALSESTSAPVWCLNAQSNPIGDAGMEALCELLSKNYKHLTHVKLQNHRKDISTSVVEKMAAALQGNDFVTTFEFEFRHHQEKDRCKKVLWRNSEAARKRKRAMK